MADNKMLSISEARAIMISYYSPKPEYFEVWFDKADNMYKLFFH